MDVTPSRHSGALTHLIIGWRKGCKHSEQVLYRFAYARLRELARVKRRKAEHDLCKYKDNCNTTALVHDAYLKITSLDRAQISRTREFYLMLAKAMQHILINRYWSNKAGKRQGDGVGTQSNHSPSLGINQLSTDKRIALEKALLYFSERYARQSNVLKLKYYVGLRNDEIARLLECSESLVEKDLKFARGWLHTKLGTSG